MSLRFLTAGESHGPKISAILEGFPAGLTVDMADVARMMARRQSGFGTGGRMRIEADEVSFTGGIAGGTTTGAPIALEIENRDHAAWRGRDIAPMTIPRPGHADLTAAVKYGYRDLRLGLERASARETAARVAVGALCAQLLARVGARVGSFVTAIGPVQASFPEPRDYPALFAAADKSDVRCPDPEASAAMHDAIADVIRARDTLGGVFEVVALGVPPGLGSHVHWDRRLTGRLAAAMTSIPAIKGVEIGPAFENAGLRGTEVHDTFALGPSDEILRRGARGGGLEGGISTGDPIVLRAAMKPISTTLTPLPSVDLAAGEAAQTAYERSDFCAVPRAAVVGEAMMAFVLADALLEMVGGDRVDLVADRVAALPTARLADLPMDAAPWRFDSPSGAGPVPSDAPAAGPDSSDAPTGERDAPVDGGPGAPSRKPPSRGPRTDISPDARARDG